MDVIENIIENDWKYIYVRENRRGYHELTIQKHWEQWTQDTEQRRAKQESQHRKPQKLATRTPPTGRCGLLDIIVR